MQIVTKLSQKRSIQGCCGGEGKGLNRMKGDKNKMERVVWLANWRINGIRTVRWWERCPALLVFYSPPKFLLK